MDAQITNSTDHLEHTKGLNKNKNCCKKVSKFVFSHIGLVLMVIVYAVAGAFLFELLEQHEEAKNCQEGKGAESAYIVNLKSNLLTYIQFNISSVPSDTGKDNETEANRKIEGWLTEFRNEILRIKTTYRYTGNCENQKWNFFGSLLFVITIFTTIGYGHIAPVTWEGQIVCICYATIGIPLFLMCLSNISGVLGDMFRFAYSRICCRLCFKNKKSKPNKNEADTTVGTDSEWKDKTNEPKVVDDNEDLDTDLKDEDEEEEKVTVPLTITMIVLTLYIILGAVIFDQFEKWGLVAAGYFCYITLATIGFGDYVPGQNEHDPNSGIKLMAGAVYLLFGMAILAMCFDLMQEEIIAKFTWLGKKLGIVGKDEEEEEEEEIENEKEKEKEDSKEKLKDSKKDKSNLSSDKTFEAQSDRDDKENLSRLRSAYFQNVVQRQFKS